MGTPEKPPPRGAISKELAVQIYRRDGWLCRPRRRVKSKYGEPLHWDGLSTLFMILAERDPKAVDSSDRAWLRALKERNLSTHI